MIRRTALNSDDKRISTALNKLSEFDSSYWEFRRQANRDGMHGLIQYPAMMVPQMQGALLKVIHEVRPDINSVLDPFVGSGTSMTEAMHRGMAFTGYDINPLAILSCRAKSGIIVTKSLEQKISSVIYEILHDKSNAIEVSFPGRDKWFSRGSSIALSRIRRSISRESSTWARALFWVIFAETIRQTSNSRTSTYKLHIRSDEQCASLRKPIDVFLEKLNELMPRARHHAERLKEINALANGRYTNRISLFCEDILSPAKPVRRLLSNLMITSPPYGDNRSTIPYGQFSYLALNWIPAEEIPADKSLFSHTYATDTASLGGRVKASSEKERAVADVSPSFKRFMSELKKLNRDDLNGKVINFVHDFLHATKSIYDQLETRSYCAWTLADRTVGGVKVPLVDICVEFQRYLHATKVAQIHRKIPSKRIPNKNAHSGTMGEECLLIMRSS